MEYDQVHLEGAPREALSAAVEQLPRGDKASVFIGSDLCRLALIEGSFNLRERDWMALARRAMASRDAADDTLMTMDHAWRSGKRLAVSVDDLSNQACLGVRHRLRSVEPLICARANRIMTTCRSASGLLILIESAALSAIVWLDGAVVEVVTMPAASSFQQLKGLVDRLRTQVGFSKGVPTHIEVFGGASIDAWGDLPRGGGIQWHRLDSPLTPSVELNIQERSA